MSTFDEEWIKLQNLYERRRFTKKKWNKVLFFMALSTAIIGVLTVFIVSHVYHKNFYGSLYLMGEILVILVWLMSIFTEKMFNEDLKNSGILEDIKNTEYSLKIQNIL